MRAVLALLVANFRSTLTTIALNQAVFQLRRVLDPGFRDGESPQYVLSTVDSVQLNPAHAVTDLDEFRRLSQAVQDPANKLSPEVADELVDLVRGEFLAELRYDDWAVRLRTAVHAEVRQTLLRIAKGDGHSNVDTAVRAACALLELDPYDEEAQLAMADQLTASGRRAAARKAIIGFAKKLRDDLDEAPSPELEAALARGRAAK
jgi:DNA-binding SARP family transcriptional activator